MRKKQYFRSAIVFLVIIFIFPIILVFSKKKSFSETEKLADYPEISMESIKNRKYMNGIETYLSDHFPLRTGMIRSKLNIERISGKELINGIYITKNAMYEKLPESNFSTIDISINAINNFAMDYSTKVSVIIAPTSAGIYSDKLKSYLSQIDQKEQIKTIYEKFSSNVNAVDIYDAMMSVRDEYIYYRTDHHWTSKGAFEAYQYGAVKMGIKPYVDYTVKKAAGDFRGTFYSKCLYKGINADRIDIYEPENDIKALNVTLNDGIKTESVSDIYFKEYLDTNDKYCLFLGENRAFTKIKTNVKSNKKLLLIKDSYANSFVPFLVQNYNEIAVVDPRYLKTAITDFVNPNDYDQTLFLYNASTFSTDQNVRNIGLK